MQRHGLQEPFNLNKVDDHGNSLLMVAAQNGNMKMVKLFIYKGANPNHQVRSVCLLVGALWASGAGKYIRHTADGGRGCK